MGGAGREILRRPGRPTTDRGSCPGWLIVCDPPEQSAGQTATAIGASRASLTTSLRLLGSVGLVRQVTKPGDRTVYYRVDDDAWETVVRRQIASLASFGEIMHITTGMMTHNVP